MAKLQTLERGIAGGADVDLWPCSEPGTISLRGITRGGAVLSRSPPALSERGFAATLRATQRRAVLP